MFPDLVVWLLIIKTKVVMYFWSDFRSSSLFFCFLSLALVQFSGRMLSLNNLYCGFTWVLNCTKNTLPSSPISQLCQIDHNQSTLWMSQFEKFEINSIPIRFENFENQFEKFEKFLVSQFEIRFDSKAK